MRGDFKGKGKRTLGEAAAAAGQRTQAHELKQPRSTM